MSLTSSDTAQANIHFMNLITKWGHKSDTVSDLTNVSRIHSIMNVDHVLLGILLPRFSELAPSLMQLANWGPRIIVTVT